MLEIATERSKLLKVPAKSVWWLLFIFISFSCLWSRRSPDASQNGDRALKAAQGTSQIGLMLVLYFYLFHLLILEMISRYLSKWRPSAQSCSRYQPNRFDDFSLFLSLSAIDDYFCLRQKLTVPSLTWNVSLANWYETHAGGLEWNEMNDILAKTHTRLH